LEVVGQFQALAVLTLYPSKRRVCPSVVVGEVERIL
jgi:hypothetical protein